MELNLDNLPEKDFFTFQEIANRWSCDEKTIDHYIFEKRILHPSIKPSDFHDNGLVPVNSKNQSDFNSLKRIANLFYVEVFYNNNDGFYIPAEHENEHVDTLLNQIEYSHNRFQP